MAINYVKFQRGSKAAYDALKNAGNLDENTLYFIYPEGENANTIGALFMGSRAISGGDIITTAASLDELADVVVTGAGANSFLVKDSNGNWVAKTAADVAALVKDNMGEIAAPAQVFQGTLQEEETATEAIARVVGENTAVAGDSVILKKLIADDKYEHTAYVYDGEAWAAMDGNYDAENVYFGSDFTFTENLGTVTIPSSGSKVVAAEGKNIKEFLAGLFAARKLPNKTSPSVSVTTPNSKGYEVGTSITPSYTTTFNKGSYTYGPDTGVTVSSWSVTLGDETLTTASGTFASITVDDNYSKRIVATASYSDGAAPKDNLGAVLTNESELNDKQIKAGTASAQGTLISGFRKAFYTSKVAPEELNSANIRNMSSVTASNSTITMSIVEGAKQVVIAVPEGRKVTKVADANAFGTDVFGSFVKQTVSVGGADATAETIGSYAKDYNVYVYSPAAALGANTYTVTIANE